MHFFERSLLISRYLVLQTLAVILYRVTGAMYGVCYPILNSLMWAVSRLVYVAYLMLLPVFKDKEQLCQL